MAQEKVYNLSKPETYGVRCTVCDMWSTSCVLLGKDRICASCEDKVGQQLSGLICKQHELKAQIESILQSLKREETMQAEANKVRAYLEA